MHSSLLLFYSNLSICILAISSRVRVCLYAVYGTALSISKMCRYKNLGASIFLVLHYIAIEIGILLRHTDMIPECGIGFGAGGGAAARGGGAGSGSGADCGCTTGAGAAAAGGHGAGGGSVLVSVCGAGAGPCAGCGAGCAGADDAIGKDARVGWCCWG